MTEKDFGEAISPSDRRGSDRKKLIIDVKFDGGDTTGIANTRDIGIGGLYMTTSTVLEIGDRVLMTMSVGGKALNLPGVVVYSDPGQGVGVRFQDIGGEDADFLRKELDLA